MSSFVFMRRTKELLQGSVLYISDEIPPRPLDIELDFNRRMLSKPQTQLVSEVGN